MAPEVITKWSYDHKVDIWSLGVTVFEMLTGKYPFCAITKQDLMFK